MNYLIIGDIHACYFTLREMLDEHWNPDSSTLIILGDFVQKGKHTFAVIAFLMELKKRQKDKCIILKGNNEHLFVDFYRQSITLDAKQKFEMYNLNYVNTIDWIDELPHLWQNDFFFVSHAGVAFDKQFPIQDSDLDVLFNRKGLQNIGKRQFVGHIVVDEPKFDSSSNAWFLDTGAGFGKRLTACKVDEEGEVLELIKLEVNPKDKVR